MQKNSPHAGALQRLISAPAFADDVRRLDVRPGRLTNPTSQAAMSAIVKLLSPCDALEIGTLFANTTRVLAEAIIDAGGSLVTIDPFGGERVPGLLAQWPDELAQITRFAAENSMSHFLSLEVGGATSGAAAPYNFVFIDGHHSFEYAYFDLISAANYLRPGGIIVVDNVEQSGPAAAVRDFLQKHKLWKKFVADGYSPSYELPESIMKMSGAILLSPEGIEVGQLPRKFHVRNMQHNTVRELRVPIIGPTPAGRLRMHANLFSIPYDLHITGKGLVSTRSSHIFPIMVGSDDELVLRIDPALVLVPKVAEAATHLEIEFIFHSDDELDDNLLIDARRTLVAA
jgi:predicted O-methyltransferase YrrM